jgi:alpha-methylacyl-CoA racemase
MAASGPLSGLRVVEFAGIGPAPFAAMLLSDLGAEVLRIDRQNPLTPPVDVVSRGRASLAMDLKSPGAAQLCLRVLEKADVLIEGLRPGAMERLGLGPDPVAAANPRLIYGRMTGWGQTGPLAKTAGHDINYISISGALEQIRPAEGPPVPPLNLVGDFGGGALYLVVGILAALHERQRSGRGQVVDAAVVDGAASMMALFTGLMATHRSMVERDTALLAGAAPNYRCYACADGRFIAVGPIEPQFRSAFFARLGFPESDLGDLQDTRSWAAAGARLEAVFATRDRDAWAKLFEGSDACVTPVLTLEEAYDHPHMAARGAYAEAFGVVQPAPAPRLSRTPGAVQGPAPKLGEGGQALAAAWGVDID